MEVANLSANGGNEPAGMEMAKLSTNGGNELVSMEMVKLSTNGGNELVSMEMAKLSANEGEVASMSDEEVRLELILLKEELDEVKVFLAQQLSLKNEMTMYRELLDEQELLLKKEEEPSFVTGDSTNLHGSLVIPDFDSSAFEN